MWGEGGKIGLFFKGREKKQSKMDPGPSRPEAMAEDESQQQKPQGAAREEEQQQQQQQQQQQEGRMFTLKKWNAVAMWSWDVECDTCAICRVQVIGSALAFFQIWKKV